MFLLNIFPISHGNLSHVARVGFTLGRDPFHCFVQKVASGSRVTETSFAFLVNNLYVLRSNYKGDSTEMLSLLMNLPKTVMAERL